MKQYENQAPPGACCGCIGKKKIKTKFAEQLKTIAEEIDIINLDVCPPA